MNRPSKIIGLTIGPKSLLLAEVSSKGGLVGGARATVGHLAEFVYPEGLSLSTPEELGKALAGFVHTEKFSTREVVVGLPARRLLTRRKEVPPAPQAMAASTLRLQAEAEFAGGGGGEDEGFTVDFAGQTSASESSVVLLMATAQSCVSQCQILIKAAGLRLRGITATGAALGRVTSSLPGGDGLIVALSAGGAELVVQHGPSATQLRHLAIGQVGGGGAGADESLGALVGEIRRTVAALPRNGSPLTLAVWDEAAGEVGGATATGSLLEKRLGMPVTSPDLRSLAITRSEAARANAYAPAVAVALVAMEASGLPVDFLHSRLAPPKEHTGRRPLVIACVAGAAIVLAIAGGVVDLQIKKSTLSALTTKHDAHLTEINRAQTAADRLRDAEKWTIRQPKYAECLRDLTNLFPDEGSSLYATSFKLGVEKVEEKDKEGKMVQRYVDKGEVAGKASGYPQVQALMDKMLKSKQFLNPRVEDVRNDTRTVSGRSSVNSGGQSFVISFTYNPAKPAE